MKIVAMSPLCGTNREVAIECERERASGSSVEGFTNDTFEDLSQLLFIAPSLTARATFSAP